MRNCVHVGREMRELAVFFLSENSVSLSRNIPKETNQKTLRYTF